MNRFTTFLMIFFLSTTSMTRTDQPIRTLFSHGLADTFAQAYNYVKSFIKNGITHTNERSIITGPVTSFNYPDATYPDAFKLFRVKFWQTSLGQDNEIRTLLYNYNILMAQSIDPIILMGLSRGAAGALNFVARHKPNNIKALILESPFDTVMGIVHDKFRNAYLRTLARMLLTCRIPFFKYNLKGIHPLDAAAHVPKNLPLLIICSLEDATVPASSSIRLYNKLKAQGHDKVHLIILQHGRHGQLLQGPDGHLYQAAVHAFYKKYDVSHDPALALQGHRLLIESTSKTYALASPGNV